MSPKKRNSFVKIDGRVGKQLYLFPKFWCLPLRMLFIVFLGKFVSRILSVPFIGGQIFGSMEGPDPGSPEKIDEEKESFLR